MFPHSCGWLSAQIQSCRRFWHCQTPQAPTGRSTAPCTVADRSQEGWRGRYEPGGCKVNGTEGKQGKHQHKAAATSDLLRHVRHTQTLKEASALQPSRHVRGGGLKLPTFQRGLATLRSALTSSSVFKREGRRVIDVHPPKKKKTHPFPKHCN